MADRPTVICLTPIKNEAWILDRFLAAASLWADVVIVADQGSVDGSREIAARHPKVTLIENPDPAYDEGSRQELLINEARRISGKRILVALDADEVLSANWRDSPEWEKILGAAPGTELRFHWANILPGAERCWIPPDRILFGFVDDGRRHSGATIHGTHGVPARPHAPALDLDEIKVVHLQYTAWERMKSKQRWYQCWEHIHHPEKRPIQIYRQYHQMDARPPTQIHPVDPRWLTPDLAEVTDPAEASADGIYWTDQEVLEWLNTYGTKRFRRLDIWEVDWRTVSRQLGFNARTGWLQDPRGLVDRLIHRWLRQTQGRQLTPAVRWLQRILIPLGW